MTVSNSMSKRMPLHTLKPLSCSENNLSADQMSLLTDFACQSSPLGRESVLRTPWTRARGEQSGRTAIVTLQSLIGL